MYQKSIGNAYSTSPQEENIHWNLKFFTLLVANSLNLSSAHSYSLQNLSVIAYIIGIHKYGSCSIFKSVNLTNQGKVAKLNSAFIIFIL